MKDQSSLTKNQKRKDAIYWIVIGCLGVGLVFMIAKPNDMSHQILSNQESIKAHVDNIDKDIESLSQSKDTAVVNQAKKLKIEIDQIKQQLLNTSKLTSKEQSALQSKLFALQSDLAKLSKEYQAYQDNITINMVEMIDLKDKEINELNEQILDLKAELESAKANKRLITVNKRTNVHFSAVALNKKNIETVKSKYVSTIWCNFKISGDTSSLKTKNLDIVISDPTGVTVNQGKMVLKPLSDYSTYKFHPSGDFGFKAGMYKITAANDDKSFEVAFALHLR